MSSSRIPLAALSASHRQAILASADAFAARARAHAACHGNAPDRVPELVDALLAHMRCNDHAAPSLDRWAAHLRADRLRPAGFVALHGALTALARAPGDALPPKAVHAWDQLVCNTLAAILMASHGPRPRLLALVA